MKEKQKKIGWSIETAVQAFPRRNTRCNQINRVDRFDTHWQRDTSSVHNHAQSRPVSYKTQTAMVKRVIEGKGSQRERGKGKWERVDRASNKQREDAVEIVNGSASVRSRVFRNHCYVK